MQNIIILILGIAFLFFLIVKCKLNSFLSLLATAIIMAFALGMDIEHISQSITKGLSSTLGGLALILAIGSMLGRLMADSGAAQRIAMSIINAFGAKNIRWSICIASSLVGFALFYEVGFILLIPIVFTIAKELHINPLEAGIPMAASLSVTHGFLPPHPAPILIADILQADISKVLLYGCMAAFPAFIFAGPIFYSFVKHIAPTDIKVFTHLEHLPEEKLPSFFISILSTLIPVGLMVLSTITQIFVSHDSPVQRIFNFIGNPNIALSIAIFIAIYTLGLRMGKSMREISSSIESGVKSIAMILFIIAAGGVLKQVLIDSGLSDYISHHIDKSHFSPLIAAWIIAACLRIALGSASVAAITTGSIVLPLALNSGVHTELMVLAIGAGSVILSLPNDPGFWMFKEFFNLSIKQTLQTWSVLETIISVAGLLMVLLLNNILS